MVYIYHTFGGISVTGRTKSHTKTATQSSILIFSLKVFLSSTPGTYEHTIQP